LDAQGTARWLRSLASDVLEHENCRGCKINAAQALADVGELEDVLARLGIEDPRSDAAVATADDENRPAP